MTIPVSVVITKSNVFTQTFANIFNLINNRSNVPNPNDISGNIKFVYSHREPNFMADNFKGFPLIVIEGINLSQDNQTANETKAIVSYEINLIIMSQDKNSDGSGNPSGADTLNSISDNIIKTLNANRVSLRNNGMKNMTINKTDFDWGEADGNPIFRREITLQFSQYQNIL